MKAFDSHHSAYPAPLWVVREIDTRGTHCPGPLLETIRLVRECGIGDTVAVVASDPTAADTIGSWVARAGHTLAAIEELHDGHRYLITRDR